MIIPLVSGRRSRALELYEKAGEMLGIGKHAEGGIVGANEVPVSVQVNNKSQSEKNAKENRVMVEMSLNPNINVSAGSNVNVEEIKKMVEQAIRGMMGDISDEMAKKLSRQFANMGMV